MSNKQARANIKIMQAPNKKRIMVGLCFYDWGPTKFWENFLMMEGWSQCDFGMQIGVYLPMAHNKLVKEALAIKEPWDYFLWLEQDTLPPSDLLRHVQHYTQPVVASLYFSRNHPPKPIAYNWHDKENYIIRNLSPHEMMERLKVRGLYKCDSVPMGCTAIRRDVLESRLASGQPWYHAFENDKGMYVSDDVYFCKWVSDAGFDIYLNTLTICRHIGAVEVNERLYIGYLEQELRKLQTGQPSELDDKMLEAVVSGNP